METNNMLAAALEYAAKGWPVFPCRGKHPLTAHGFKDATTDTGQIRQWWEEKWPSANIGIPTGAASGILAVDIDGDAGKKSLLELEDKYGALPATRTITTRPGRFQYWLAQPPGVKTKSTASALGLNLDIRGDGGYVIAPPSIHPDSKKPYLISRNGAPAEAPAWLIELTRADSGETQRPAAEAIPDQLPWGVQNTTLTSIAGSMRRRGMSAEAIEAALQVENQRRCVPPMPAREVTKIAKSVARYTAAAPGEGFPSTDGENADRFAAQHAQDVRYCTEQRIWYAWDGKRWQRDAVGEVMRRGRETAASIYGDAWKQPEEDGKRKRAVSWALRADSKVGLDAMVSLARWDSRIEVTRFGETFDRDALLLNCQNGIVNLATGEVGPHRREAMMTKITPIACDAACGITKFEAYVKKTFGESEEMITFMQQLGGYCLTGLTGEQAFFIFYGKADTGKSTYVKLQHGVMGEYVVQIPGKVLLDKPAHAKDYDTALLAGVRLATTVETGPDKKLDEEAIKAITGQDILRGERKYEHSFEFRSQAKLILATNYKPNVHEGDDAIWRRIKPIPFHVKVPDGERVDSFEEKLIAEEGPGILVWYVAGAAEWKKNKNSLAYPDEVTKAAEEYRKEQDEVAEFLDECCQTDASNLLSKAALFAEYAIRTAKAKMKPMTKKRFGMEMGRLGYEEGSGRDHVKWRCIRFNPVVQQAIDDRILREKAETAQAQKTLDGR